jgi:hypothetical protein
MNLFGKAAEAADVILRAFENPASLPTPLATIFIHRKDDCPCRSWSWGNQLIAALHGHSDARGYRQWELAGRTVKHGEKAFYILSPCVKPITDQDTGEKKNLLYGFKGTAVFGYDQTEGDPLPVTDPALRGWLQALPLREVADEWGVSVEVYDGRAGDRRGVFRWAAAGGGEAIALGVQNLSTWAHELVHAADRRNGKLKELGQHWRSETVAELGGAVLLTALGLKHDADLGGCWNYIKSYARKERIEALQACSRVLERTCLAVALVLDTAEAIRAEAGREVA